MKVFVVTANDFPDSVWLEKPVAQEYIAKLEPKKQAERDRLGGRRIHWAIYEFELDKAGT